MPSNKTEMLINRYIFFNKIDESFDLNKYGRSRAQLLQSLIKMTVGSQDLAENTQCPRTDLNKRFLPKPMTTTG